MDGNIMTSEEIADGVSCGYDGLSNEHFKFADKNLFVYLSLIFNAMLLHGHVPEKFMLTLIAPIITNKKGCVTDCDNYRPIAITTVA